MQFKIVEGDSAAELQGAVNEYLNNGWRFLSVGDIHVTHVRAGELCYTVAMLKLDESEA